MDMIPGLFLVVIALGLYFIPAIAAAGREHRQVLAIFILNLFLGWTLVGWVGALVWACTKPVTPVLMTTP
jgi:hypothetical protein